MAVYVIFIREETTDQAELDTYGVESGHTLAVLDFELLAAFGRQDVLEGPAPEGVAIAKFPSFKALRNWYDSPAYQKAAQHRFKGARYRAFAVEGLKQTNKLNDVGMGTQGRQRME